MTGACDRLHAVTKMKIRSSGSCEGGLPGTRLAIF
jgi:hypothetical protein